MAIIVSGCPRSGTSLMMNWLLMALGEHRLVGRKWPQEDRDLLQDAWESDESFAARKHMLTVLKQMRRDKDKEHIVDMNPNGFWESRYTVPGIQWHVGIENIIRSDSIIKVVSQGLMRTDPKYVDKVIFMLREPREVAKSQENLKKWLSEETEKHGLVENSPEMFVKTGLGISAWIKNVKPDLLVVNHADLMKDPDAVGVRLAEFLGEGDFSTNPIDKKLHRSKPEVHDHILWPLAECIYESMCREDWDDALNLSDDERQKLLLISGLFCTRLRRRTAYQECLNCRSNPVVVSNFSNTATQRKINWKEEPCIYECLVEDVAIEDSVRDNHWLPHKKSVSTPERKFEMVDDKQIRVLPKCVYRGEEISWEEVACCGGKIRINRSYECCLSGQKQEVKDSECQVCQFVIHPESVLA